MNLRYFVNVILTYIPKHSWYITFLCFWSHTIILMRVLLTLWLQSFFATLELVGRNFYKPSSGTDFLFQCLGLLFGTDFSLVLMFPGLRIEAPPPIDTTGRCTYTLLKWRTSRFNFNSYVLNLVKINISYYLSRLVITGPIYRPSMRQ